MKNALIASASCAIVSVMFGMVFRQPWKEIIRITLIMTIGLFLLWVLATL